MDFDSRVSPSKRKRAGALPDAGVTPAPGSPLNPPAGPDDAGTMASRPRSDVAGGPRSSSRRAPRRTVPTISVVIPTLNEAKNLGYVLGRLPDHVQVVLVDGRSVDGSAELASRLRADIKVISQQGHGKGDALATGFAACDGDIIVTIDADGSNDPREIDSFVRVLLDGADFAKGSRFLPGGRSHDITSFRRLGNHALRLLVNVLFGTSYTDLCYGYNAFWTDCLEHMRVDCNGFEVETLMHIRIAKSGLDIRELPSVEGKRLSGRSNLNAFRDGSRVLKTILFERFARDERRLHRRPVATPIAEPNS